MGRTHASHILPFRLGKHNNRAQEKSLGNVWRTLYALFPAIKAVIDPNSINQERNAMTLYAPLNQEWGRLAIALEETDTENVYKVVTYGDFPGMLDDKLPQPVHFTKPSDVSTELPSPELLKVHASIARVLHATGMVEAIDDLLRDIEDVEKLHSMDQLTSRDTALLMTRLSLLALR